MLTSCSPRKISYISSLIAAAILFAASAANAAPLETLHASVSSVVPSLADGNIGETPTLVRVRKLDVPKYPQQLVNQGIEGTIGVRAEVDAAGKVTDASIAFSTSPKILAVQESVLRSVRNATFYPSSIGGQPTHVAVIVPFHFQVVDEVVSRFPFKRVARSVGDPA